jgi:hypothetical protein
MKKMFIVMALLALGLGCGRAAFQVTGPQGPTGSPGLTGPAGPTGPSAPTPTATPAPVAPTLSAGLLCNLYNLAASQPSSLPSFSPGGSQAVVSGQVPAGPIAVTFVMTEQINFSTQAAMLAGSGSTLTTWYALDCTGVFNVPATQVYNLTLNSDDGSQLLIDGVSIIDNDGEHSATSKSGSIALEAGQHSVELQYFQGPGVVELQLLSNIGMEFSH